MNTSCTPSYDINDPFQLKCRNYRLDLSSPKVMGILNVTEDSFFDGNKYLELDVAIKRAETMVAEGAAIIDVGGESTRPGAKKITLQEELDRVIPVVEKLVKSIDVPISIDTSRPEVMQEAYSLGVSFINDVRALTSPGALEIVSKLNIPVCLMHMQNSPDNMQESPKYDDILQEIKDFLIERVNICCAKGILKSQIIIDPGFGFGKTLNHNLKLLKKLDSFKTIGCPILVGLSQKSMIGQVLNAPLGDRIYGSLAAAIIAYLGGAIIIRVHDVKPTVQALQMAEAISKEEANNYGQYK